MKHVTLLNPKTINKYFHFSHGWLDHCFAWCFRKLYDKRFEIPSHTYCTTMPPITLYALEALFGNRCKVTVIDEQVDLSWTVAHRPDDPRRCPPAGPVGRVGPRHGQRCRGRWRTCASVDRADPER